MNKKELEELKNQLRKEIIAEIKEDVKANLIKEGVIPPSKRDWLHFRNKILMPTFQEHWGIYDGYKVYSALLAFCKYRYGKEYLKLKGEEFQAMEDGIRTLVKNWFDIELPKEV